MICDMCGNEGARVKHVSRSYGQGSELIIVEGVPVVSCPGCGESYLTAETAKHIDEIRSDRTKLTETREVAVTGYV